MFGKRGYFHDENSKKVHVGAGSGTKCYNACFQFVRTRYRLSCKDVDKDAIGITVVELTDNDDNSLAVVGGIGE